MLKENQDARPNIYQVLKEACVMQGIDTPVKDVSCYATVFQTTTPQILTVCRSIPADHNPSHEAATLPRLVTSRPPSSALCSHPRPNHNKPSPILSPCGEAAPQQHLLLKQHRQRPQLNKNQHRSRVPLRCA